MGNVRKRNARNTLLISHSTNLINDEEFLMLYDHNTSKNPDFSCWNHQQFDLKNISDEECKAELKRHLLSQRSITYTR